MHTVHAPTLNPESDFDPNPDPNRDSGGLLVVLSLALALAWDLV